MRHYVDVFSRKMHDFFDITAWFAFTTFDLIGGIALGEPFGWPNEPGIPLPGAADRAVDRDDGLEAAARRAGRRAEDGTRREHSGGQPGACGRRGVSVRVSCAI